MVFFGAGRASEYFGSFFRGKVILYLGEQEIHSAVVEAGPDSKAAFTAENLPCGQAEEWSPGKSCSVPSDGSAAGWHGK